MLLAAVTDPPIAAGANELCGQTVTESTTLGADQTCTGDGLIIVGDGLTIDLGGFTLSGDGDAGDVGIDVSGAPHVTIRNGTVRGFSIGVGTQSAPSLVVKLSDVTLRGNVVYGIAPGTSTLIVDRCSVLENGIGLVHDSQTLKITSTAFVANTGSAMEIHSNVATLKNVVSVGNGDHGLRLTGSGGKISVRSSLFARNGLAGVFVHDEFTAPPGKISVMKCTIAGNGTDGVLLNGDFDAQHRVTVTVAGNLITGNGASGVHVTSDSDRTVVSANRIIGNADDGVTIDATSDDTVVKGNTVVGNAHDGISTANSTATLAKNVVNANYDAAIDAPAGALDGGGNRARANGQAVLPCSSAIACPPAFTPKPGPVTPTCGMHVTTSITLGDDLSCNGTTGMFVDADGVAINLNGHRLDGGASQNTIGIAVQDHGGITVANGVVQRFQVGVGGGSGDNLKLVNVEMRENTGLGATYAGGHVAVSKSSFVRNGERGFEVPGPAVAVKVTDSLFVGNVLEGFGSRGRGTLLTNVVAATNGGAGVRLGPDGDGRLQKSIVAGNGGDGVQITDGFGVSVPSAVKKTVIVGNRMDGIVVATNPVGMILEGNVAGANGGHGVALMSTPDRTTINKNMLVGNVSDGVFVDVAVQATSITRNTAPGNGGSGLNVDAAASTLAKNLAVANVLSGIRTPFGAIDGGGNEAHDNIAPQQCTPPIACP